MTNKKRLYTRRQVQKARMDKEEEKVRPVDWKPSPRWHRHEQEMKAMTKGCELLD